MDDRYRELERPLALRKKDVVLLATVSSFEEIRYPGKSDLKQFSELFPPLFSASSAEARRQAAAALSRCEHVPDAVALFLGRQPVEIAALFLTPAVAVSDQVLITIASLEGEDHARAIARRENLSAEVVDTLVGLRHDRLHKRKIEAEPAAAIEPQAASRITASPTPLSTFPASTVLKPIEEESRMPNEDRMEDEPAPIATEASRLEREEQLRQNIKALARHLNPPEDDRQGLRHIQPVEMALFNRFARTGEIGLFTTALSYALSCTRWLAERILLDMSGNQLATTLVSLGMPDTEAAEVLCGIYPHLKVADGHGNKAEALLESLDLRDCDLRVDSWLRADTYSFPAADEQAKVRRFKR